MTKYEQKQLELMTDRQLDAICAVHNGYGEDWVERHPELVPNYCNTWLCCGELIDECGIIADGNGSALIVIDEEYRHIVKCEVKRAVVIVYILVMQGEYNIGTINIEEEGMIELMQFDCDNVESALSWGDNIISIPQEGELSVIGGNVKHGGWMAKSKCGLVYKVNKVSDGIITSQAFEDVIR